MNIMPTHSHLFWMFLSSNVTRSVMALLLFAEMMLWTAWMLLASVWADAERAVEYSVNHISWNDAETIAEGAAYQGPWRMNDSDFRYVDDASVAMTDEGNTALEWVDQARKEVLFQWHGLQDEGDHSDPVVVSGSPGTFSWLPRITFCPAGCFSIVNSSYIDGEQSRIRLIKGAANNKP